MAEQDQCIPEPDPNHPLMPAGWEESAGFRETFLYHFNKLEDSLALRHLAQMLHEQGLEMARYAPPDGESATRAELRAVAADLRHAQGFLAAVARSKEESELAPVDAELAALAARHAWAVAGLAAKLEQAIA